MFVVQEDKSFFDFEDRFAMVKEGFVGEEPLDRVTEQYNECMKETLSAHGLQVAEIPRKALPDGTIVSASTVRKLYWEGKFEEMRRLLPKTTYDFLVNHWDKYSRKQ